MRMPALLPIPLTSSQTRSVALLLALMVASALTEGFGLLLIVPMIGALGEGGESSEGVTEVLAALGVPLSLPWLLAMFVALVLLRAAVNHARAIQAFRFQMVVVDGLRDRAWKALLHADWRHLSGLRRTDSASLLISNIDRVGHGIAQALRGLAVLVTLGGLGLAALAISPALAVSAAAIGIAVMLAYRGVRRRAQVLGEKLGRDYDRVHAGLGEGLGALRVIKSFGREAHAADEMAESFAGLRRTQLAYIRSAGLAQAALQAAGALLLALLVWLAIERWQAGAAQVLPLVALFARALPLLGVLQGSWQEWAHARPAADKAMALIEEAEAASEAQASDASAIPRLAEALVLEDVCVSFEERGRRALEDISINIPAQSVTAIGGPSGAGKSTLADVIGGLLSPDHGIVKVDGVRLDAGLRRGWRERVTYVQQEPVLFTGTVRENLLWADPDADDDRLSAVLRDASAGFVADLPDGLDTRIGEAGRSLSGGERQRLVLARALLRNPSLLILDEASSALDAENEAAIADAVSRLRDRMAIVIIGHRGTLAELASRTVLLEHGRIVTIRT